MAPIGVVLTGGASTRMGVDKALLVVDGQALAVRAAAVLVAGGCSVAVCQGGDRERLTALGLPMQPDLTPGQGPLPAILDALRAAAPRHVVVSACDLIGVEAGHIEALIAASAGDPASAVVAIADRSGPHLLGLWRASTADLLQILIDGGLRSYRAALDLLDAKVIEYQGAVIDNINDAGDLDRHR
jgi:molybdenum cofactor guanylyltransferase